MRMDFDVPKFLRRTMLAAALIGAFGVGVVPVSGQAGRAKVEEGNRLYEEGRFDEAHQRYLEALAEDPESELIRFNDGNALYQNADFQQAMEAYQQAIESGDPQLVDAAWYNLGNALYRSQQLEPSLEAYKQALRRNPGDIDAKHNLERVLQDMQEQEQQEDQQQDEENQDQQDQNQEQENQDQQDQNEQDQDEQDQQDQEQQDQEQQGEPDEPEPEDPEDPQDPQDSDENPDENPESEEGQGEAQPSETGMSPEEAQRLLDAIEEDPGDVNRKPAAARGRKPRKPW